MNTYKSSTQDFSGELRQTYLGAVPHTLCTAIVWISCGLWGYYVSKYEAMIIFIVAGTFIFPGGELIRKIMRAPNVLSKENRLPQLFTLMAFTIPLSYPLVYLIVKNNINLFFSSFTILIGAHYLPFIYGYRMYTFGLLASLLVTLGTYFSVQHPNEFSLPALIAGAILLTFAIIHYFMIKKQTI
jgi:hypothetical protein